MNTLNIAINNENDVIIARNTAKDYAQDMGFDKLACAEIALGVSEIAHNVIRYAIKGVMWLNAKQENCLHIIIKDEGEGIKNFELAKQDGFSSTENSLGIGLGVAERSFDNLVIDSKYGEGTTVTLEKYIPIPPYIMDIGIASMKDERYEYNGDLIFTQQCGGNELLAVIIDGAGQGYNANQIAHLIKLSIQSNITKDLDEIIIQIDRSLRNSTLEGGAVLSLAKISPTNIEYIGIGDTHAYLKKEDLLQCLHNTDGVLGEFHLPTLKVRKYPVAPPYQLIICTDGIHTLLTRELPDINLSAQQMANSIFNKHHRLYGDASVFVLNHLPYES